MEAEDRKKATRNVSGAPAPEGDENESFFQRRSVLLSALLVGLALVVAVPTLLLSVAFNDNCDSGNELIDNACLNAKKRAEEMRRKKDKFNVRPKKEPFGFVEKPRLGVGGLNQGTP